MDSSSDELILIQILPMFCQTVETNRISHSKLRHSFFHLKAMTVNGPMVPSRVA